MHSPRAGHGYRILYDMTYRLGRTMLLQCNTSHAKDLNRFAGGFGLLSAGVYPVIIPWWFNLKADFICGSIYDKEIFFEIDACL